MLWPKLLLMCCDIDEYDRLDDGIRDCFDAVPFQIYLTLGGSSGKYQL